MSFPTVPVSLVELEEAVLAIWREEDTFRLTQERTAGAEQFVFFEGPPTANGRPGLHHVISRAIKDLVCRYQTMLGKHVTRIAGWDTHGLPVEIEAQKQLGIEDKKEIEERGIAWFNEQCRKSVFNYKEEWERFSERIGYWLDYSRPYITFEKNYVESVWWLLKQMADRGLLYRGHKVVPWCPSDQTVLSSHELSLGYKDVKDPSLYLTVELLDGSGRHLLVWTTTPWTLVANVALAVNPKVEYVEVEHENQRLIVAEKRAETLFEANSIRGRIPADELVGTRYRRPFELIPAEEAKGRAWEVISGDFVSDAEGSGIVHMAPAYGADDYRAGQELGLAVLEPVQEDGRFAADLPLVGGTFVKEADDFLVAELKAKDAVFKYSRESHSYPHCWRCQTPLIYMARHSWFARTSSLQEEMVRNNNTVAWHPPEVGERRFGDWLKGNVDWALSRDRYWGTPLPVWVSEDDPEHAQWIGSFQELAEKIGELPDDFDPHRPFIDDLTWQCPETGATMRRTPEVLDVWFDSGAMPWAQWHYPFANRDSYERHFPADFICEAIDQTRGWFYSLHSISTMLGLGPAFRNVIVNDMILDGEGRKMAKSRGNVINPWDAIAEHGADAVRWYMITVSNPWLPTRFDATGVRGLASRFFDTLFNTYRFFALYANVERWQIPALTDDPPPLATRPTLDRWLLSRLHSLTGQVQKELDGYNPTQAYRALATFVDDDLSNWYVRRSRSRFWGNTDQADQAAAFATLHEALRVVALLIAPITPFTSDWLHRVLTANASAHTEAFPKAEPSAVDVVLEEQMAHVRSLSKLARAAREEVGIRVRQPLDRIMAVVPGTPPAGELLALLADEVNVKKVEFIDSSDALVSLSARPNYRSLGKRFKKQTEEAAARVRELDEDALASFAAGQEATIEVGCKSWKLEADDLEVVRQAKGHWAIRSEGGYTVALDPTLTEVLRQEGIARELVSRIQKLRRESGLEVTDRIHLGVVAASDAVTSAIREHEVTIAGETLAVAVEVIKRVDSEATDGENAPAPTPTQQNTAATDFDFHSEEKLNDEDTVTIGLSKVKTATPRK